MQKSSIVNRVCSIYDNIQPNKLLDYKFNLILCNKRYFTEDGVVNYIAWGLTRIPFYVYLIAPNKADGSNPEKTQIESLLKNTGFKKHGTITGIIDKEIWKCAEDVADYNKIT